MRVYRVVKGTIQHSPLTSFVFSQNLNPFSPQKVWSYSSSECVHVLAVPDPFLFLPPHLSPLPLRLIVHQERTSKQQQQPCLLLHPCTTATHKYLSLIFGFFWILAFTTKVLNKKQIFNTFFPILPSSTLVFAVPDREINSGKCISAAILTVIKCKSKSQRKPQTMFTSFIFVFQQFISLFLSSLGT